MKPWAPVLGVSLPMLSITSTTFRVVLAMLAVGALGGTLALIRRRRWSAAAIAILSLALVAANVGAAINAHYQYFPNVASLWDGYHGRDQATWDHARSLRSQAVAATGIGTTAPPVISSGHLQRGLLVRVSIPGTLSGFHARRAEVYLPPAWVQHPAERLPVLFLLHGTPGSPEDWSRSAHADEIADHWAEGHAGRAPILVMPDINGQFWRDSECTDGTAGRLDTYLSLDVPRWVQTHLAPSADHHQWGVGGLSEGGLCAVDLTLRHPTTFSTFLDFSGDDHITHNGGALSLFRGTPSQRRSQLQSYEPDYLLTGVSRRQPIHGWFEVGAKDRGTEHQMERLVVQTRRQGIEAHFRIRAGYRHNFGVWALSLQDSFAWMDKRLAGPGPAPASSGSVDRPTSTPRTVAIGTGPPR